VPRLPVFIILLHARTARDRRVGSRLSLQLRRDERRSID